MTYREWFIQTTGKFGMTAGDAELILTNQQDAIPDPDAAVDVNVARRALIDEAETLIPMANITEGGYSVSWDREAFFVWYRATCKKLGIEDTLTPHPTATDRSNIW